MSNEGYHEPVEELSGAAGDMRRPIVSLMEELEAVDRRSQRVDTCKDADFRVQTQCNLGVPHEKIRSNVGFCSNPVGVRPGHFRDPGRRTARRIPGDSIIPGDTV